MRTWLARVLSAALVTAAVVVGPATPASAHAVLLRTDPAPQATVGTSPQAVRLFFSEPVDAVFGGIRVFDVDGRRVDTATARHLGGADAALELPVPRLADGTYTVTWRVVSADGHPVRGGFVFYVGAPSAISSVAIAGEQGASSAVSWAAGMVRAVWFVAFALLIGLAVARRFVWTPASRLAAPAAAAPFRRRTRRLLPAAWALLAIATALSLGFEAAKVSGLPVGTAFGADALGEMLQVTYGRIWRVEALLVVLLALPVAVLARRRPPPLVGADAWLGLGGALTAALAVAAVLNGHARTDPHPVWAVSSVALHLLVAAAWVGGLLALLAAGLPAFRAAPADRRSPLLREVLRRFSPFAVGAVVVVVATGTVTSVLSFHAVSDLWRVTYGRLVLAKIVLLAGALAVAARHLLVLPGHAETATDDRPVRSFGTGAGVEALLLVAALSVAAALVDQVPGRSIALAAAGPATLEQRAGADTVQLFLDPTAVGANELHVTFVDASGLADAAVTNVTATLTSPGTSPADVGVQLVAPGHFAGDVTIPAAGRYQLRVRTTAGPPLDTTFTFTIKEKQ